MQGMQYELDRQSILTKHKTLYDDYANCTVKAQKNIGKIVNEEK